MCGTNKEIPLWRLSARHRQVNRLLQRNKVICFTGNASKSLREWLSITKEAAIQIWMAAFKRNDDEYYPYYTIRAQDDYTKRKLKFERQHFPNLEVLLDFACNPNSKTLYTRIKESLKAKRVVFKGNLEPSDVTEQQLMNEMAKREVC